MQCLGKGVLVYWKCVFVCEPPSPQRPSPGLPSPGLGPEGALDAAGAAPLSPARRAPPSPPSLATARFRPLSSGRGSAAVGVRWPPASRRAGGAGGRAAGAMNFSEAFKLSGLLCKFSPDGKYLVSGGAGPGGRARGTRGPGGGVGGGRPQLGDPGPGHLQDLGRCRTPAGAGPWWGQNPGSRRTPTGAGPGRDRTPAGA